VKSNELRIMLMGGLGNQLFQVAAGMYMEQKLGKSIKFSTGALFKIGNNHQNDVSTLLDAFDCQGKEENISKTRFIISKRLFEVTDKARLSAFLPFYFSKEAGFDPNLADLQSPKTVFGYFQTWRYFRELQDKSFFRNLIPQSSRSLEIIKEILDNDGIAVHVRRGDYLDHRHSNGLLSSLYYADALEAISASNNSPVYVFSDDLPTARTVLGRIINRQNMKFVDGLGSLEGLAVISHSSRIIVANSTYSYWAGMLSSDGSQIVAPSKWYKGLADPKDLIPKNWRIVQSKWE